MMTGFHRSGKYITILLSAKPVPQNQNKEMNDPGVALCLRVLIYSIVISVPDLLKIRSTCTGFVNKNISNKSPFNLVWKLRTIEYRRYKNTYTVEKVERANRGSMFHVGISVPSSHLKQ